MCADRCGVSCQSVSEQIAQSGDQRATTATGNRAVVCLCGGLERV